MHIDELITDQLVNQFTNEIIPRTETSSCAFCCGHYFITEGHLLCWVLENNGGDCKMRMHMHKRHWIVVIVVFIMKDSFLAEAD